jgi:hypothetical protein
MKLWAGPPDEKDGMFNPVHRERVRLLSGIR